MARPLQKKKNKSSLHRVRQKPKSKRINIKSNPIVAANWDQALTLSQNYHRLGLSSKLNSQTGGTEHRPSSHPTTSNPQKPALAIPSSKAPKTLGASTAKVTRDPTGAIISVQEDPSKRKRENPLNDPLNDLSDSDSDIDDGEGDGAGMRRGDTGIIKDLEASAKLEKKKRPRLQSEREREWCRRLVKRWGDDWGGMGRDRRLNPLQQSVGDLRRRIEVWRAGGGRVDVDGEGEVEMES